MRNWKTAIVGGLAGVGLSVGVMLWVQSVMESPGPETTAQNNATPQSAPPPGASGSPPPAAGDSKPHLLASLESEQYNLVAFNGKIYGLPWGLEVDWSQPPEAGDGVFIEPDRQVVEAKIRDRAGLSVADDGKPHLVKSNEAFQYNVVAYRGRFYGVPWGLEVDWSAPPDPGADNGVLVGDDMVALEKKIHTEGLKNPQPQLLKSSERYKYNVVAFRGKLYGLPWGLDVDWSQPPEPTPENGVLIDDSMESLQQRIREQRLGHID